MKKKYVICAIILLFSSVIFITGCSELKKTNTLTFTPTYERQSLGCFTPFIHKEKMWQYSQLQFFISNVEVKNHHGQWQNIPLSENKYQSDNVALLGEYCQATTINHATIEKAANQIDQGHWQLLFEQPLALSNISQLRFTLGVPFSLNHQNPLLQKSPLNVPNMFWVWQTGHKFFRLDMEEVNNLDQKDNWLFHLGSTGCKAPSALRAPKQRCDKGNQVSITLDIAGKEFEKVSLDLAQLFSGLMITEENSCQSGSYNDSCLPLFKNIGLIEGDKQTVFMLHPIDKKNTDNTRQATNNTTSNIKQSK
jgi:uncharacterized repeat protein (TIGR04052 family)